MLYIDGNDLGKRERLMQEKEMQLIEICPAAEKDRIQVSKGGMIREWNKVVDPPSQGRQSTQEQTGTQTGLWENEIALF